MHRGRLQDLFRQPERDGAYEAFFYGQNKMAGDWLKMRLDLQTHPKVVRILSATKSDKFRTIGGLHAVWSVFDTHSSDGRLTGYTPETLDHIIGWNGFSDAMMAVGWLESEDPDALVLPDFDEHNGKGGKRRAEDMKRKRGDRENPQSVRNLSANEPDKKLTREEKRREEIEKNKESKTKATSKSSYDPLPYLLEYSVSEQTANDWLALRKSKRAVVTATVLSNIAAQAQKAGLTLEAVLTICCARGWSGFDADWILKDQRAGPAGYQTANEKAKAWADELTGKTPRNGNDNTIIDIN